MDSNKSIKGSNVVLILALFVLLISIGIFSTKVEAKKVEDGVFLSSQLGELNPYKLLGVQAPNFFLPLVNEDTKIALSDYKDKKVVLLNFWSPKCVPCEQEIPTLIDIQLEYEKQGVTVIGVSIDDNEPEIVKEYLTKNRINYPIVITTQEVIKSYPLITKPATYVISKKGYIIDILSIATKEKFEASIQKALR